MGRPARATPKATPKAAERAAGKPRLPRRGTPRAVRTEMTRAALFDAAARVVGKHGYAGASVARITREAGVAQGTFYNYFTSQQDVFDQLLPYLGERLLNRIREKLEGCNDAYEREAIGFRAYFDFLSENPEFERILSEAAVFTPQGFRDHVQNIVSGYMRAFRYSRARGVLPHYSERELEAVTYMLLGARAYLSQRFMANDTGATRKLPEWAFTAYMKFMRYGLTGPRRSPKAARNADIDDSSEAPTQQPEILEVHPDGATVSARHDPSHMEFAALLASMATVAARAAISTSTAGRNITVSHFSCSVLGQEPDAGSVIRATAQIDGREDGPRSISIRYETEHRAGEILATALMTSSAMAR